MNQLLVSVVIPCYNQGEFLKDAIDSVQNSTYKRVEIIVVDDGSTEYQTRKVIDEISKDANITVIQQPNKGLPSARNAGILAARGEYVLPLDADDVIYPTFIMKAVWRLAKRPYLGIVYCLVQLFGDVEEVWYTDEFNADVLLHHNFIPATALYRRTMWSEVGGYDQSMRTGYEDWEFWIRCVRAGWVAERINETLFGYRRHGHTMLHASRQSHEEILKAIHMRHRDAYTLFWKLRLAYYYAKRKLGRQLRRMKQSLRMKFTADVLRMIKLFIYKIRPKRLPALPIPKSNPEAELALEDRCTNAREISIVIILPWLQIGGVERVVLNLLAELEKSPFRTYIFTTLNSHHSWEREFLEKVDGIFHLATMLDNDQDRVDFICDFIRMKKIQCVHISNSEFGYALTSILKLACPQTKILDTLHMEEPYEPWDYVRLSNSVKQHIDKRVVVTPSLRDRLVDIYNNQENDVIVIENGIQTEPLSQLKQGTQTRDAIVFVGRFVKQKRPLMFVEIAVQLLRSNKSLKFIMVGDGPLSEEIYNRISQYHAGDSISVEEPTSAWRILGERALMLVAPSLWEGLPMIGLESIGLGVPIIASNVPGWSDLIESGVDGILVSPYDITRFCETIRYLLNAEDIRARFNERAYAKLESLYLAERMGRLYQELYYALINK